MKKILSKLYGGLKMSWPAVILFAVAAGLYTGLVMCVPALKDTSFQDIGVMYEWWVIFAVIIVTNCRTGAEGMLKCFVFFLISQPLIYGVEIITGTTSLTAAWGYYRSMWLPVTFLTLPGGYIAYHCKKQNALGAVILALGCLIQAALCVRYCEEAIAAFPHHVLSALVCAGSVFVMIFGIQKKKSCRWTAFGALAGLLIILAVLLKLTGRTF